MPDRIDLNDLEQFMQTKNKKENEVEVLASTDNIKLLTRLSADEIRAISKAYYVTEILEIDEITKLLDNVVELKVSEKGKGRKEIVDVLKGRNSNMGMFNGGGFNGFGR